MDRTQAFLFGCFVGAVLMSWIARGTISLYREWYAMVRRELEKLDPTNPALVKVGASLKGQSNENR
jgi:hypothetical protein